MSDGICMVTQDMPICTFRLETFQLVLLATGYPSEEPTEPVEVFVPQLMTEGSSGASLVETTCCASMPTQLSLGS